MDGHGVASTYFTKLQAFKKSDEDRNALVEELIQAYEELKMKYEEQSIDFEDAKKSRRDHQKEARLLKSSIVRMEHGDRCRQLLMSPSNLTTLSLLSSTATAPSSKTPVRDIILKFREEEVY